MKKSFDSKGQFAWDSTSIKLAQTCLRAYYYKMILDLEPRTPSVHLLFGGEYARALEHYYKYRALGDDLDEALRKVIRECLIRCKGVAFVHNTKTLPNLIRSIVWYVDEFAEIEKHHEVTTYHLADGSPAVELSFALELDDDLVYCGHLDRVIQFAGEFFILDQKTTGNGLSDYYFAQFKPSTQMMGYTWAGKILLKTPVKGVMIDAADIKVGGTNFQRRPVMFTDEQLYEWLDSVRYYAGQVRGRDPSDPKAWPMNYESCDKYGGCEFKELCSRSPHVRANFIKGDYQTRTAPWDPLEAR